MPTGTAALDVGTSVRAVNEEAAVRTVRVVVADDNLFVRSGIERLLDEEGGFEVVASCGSYDEALQAVADHSPDVVLTDICMPPTSTDEGIRLAEELRRARPDVGVVVLSQYAEASYALGLVAGGSQRRSYLLKERVAAAGQLAAALRTVAEGGSFIDPVVVERLVAAQSRSTTSPLSRLTVREREVLGEIAGGGSNASIATRLVITERAVEKHVNSIFSKLGLTEEGDRHRRVSAVLLYLADTAP
jgi:DNA-binding NarL/FixJ family response regulator